MDGVDIYATYGAFVSQDGYKSLVQWPALKQTDSNDWAEEDGIEVDLSAPVLDARQISLSMAFLSEDSYLEFREALLMTEMHDFEFREIGRSVWLRMVSESGLKTVQGLHACTFKFSDDTPLRDYVYQGPESGQSVSDGYAIDGKDLMDYGIRVLKGTLTEVVSMPQVKESLEIESKYMPGVQHDGGWGKVRMKDKTASLKLLMRAESLQGLWRNYDALLYNLVLPGEHSLTVESEGIEHKFHYSSCSVEKFYATGKIWLEFSLKLRVVLYGHPDPWYILSAVDGREISTEDGKPIVMEESFKS